MVLYVTNFKPRSGSERDSTPTELLYIITNQVKGRSLTCQYRHRGGVGLYLYSYLTSALDGGWCSAPRPGDFNSEKGPRYSWCKRLDGLLSRSGRAWRTENLLSVQEFEPRTVYSVGSRYDDYAISSIIINTGLRNITSSSLYNPYPTAFPYGNGMVLHFYQQQESSTTKIVHKVINRGLKTYV